MRKIGHNVTVEPFAYIAGDVVIGDDCWIGPGAVIHDGARIGKGCKIHTAASISCLPQDLKFAGEVTTAEIGDYNDIREYVTISRGTASRGKTRRRVPQPASWPTCTSPTTTWWAATA